MYFCKFVLFLVFRKRIIHGTVTPGKNCAGPGSTHLWTFGTEFLKQKLETENALILWYGIMFPNGRKMTYLAPSLYRVLYWIFNFYYILGPNTNVLLTSLAARVWRLLQIEFDYFQCWVQQFRLNRSTHR